MKGKVYSLMARALVFYALYKSAMSIYNFLMKQKYSIDPVTRGITIFCHMAGVDLSYATLFVSQLSFGFIGVLIFTNIRSFANLMVSVINTCGRLISSGFSSDLLLLFLAEVMGAYFMATVLMMRSNLPESNR